MVARANAHVRYPARVQLVAAMNPCRCGHGGAGRGACGKAPRCIRDYQGRVSGPLMDRIDLAVDMPAVTAADLSLPPPSEGTAEVAARVARARRLQVERAEATPGAPSGAEALNGQGRGPLPGDDRRSRRDRARPAGPGRRGRPDQRPRLDPRPAPGPHHRRPGGRDQRPPGARGRGPGPSADQRPGRGGGRGGVLRTLRYAGEERAQRSILAPSPSGRGFLAFTLGVQRMKTSDFNALNFLDPIGPHPPDPPYPVLTSTRGKGAWPATDAAAGGDRAGSSVGGGVRVCRDLVKPHVSGAGRAWNTETT
jgi:hypothetical protein